MYETSLYSDQPVRQSKLACPSWEHPTAESVFANRGRARAISLSRHTLAAGAVSDRHRSELCGIPRANVMGDARRLAAKPNGDLHKRSKCTGSLHRADVLSQQLGFLVSRGDGGLSCERDF